ncbi:hypothetical protein [uncultured Cyclobacterium sp.]|uniref:hypothetical protein n=1 Tax=uncultured Cyclobacterium sp. TaxID=453820 RepID=UPI0030EBCEA1|tara:strand:+ start:1403 stop:2005 length:603 start_codon:yes stop_codon:yes gene_type:complete
MDIPALVQEKPLYTSIEIRWFFNSPIKELMNFVTELSFKNEPETRTDIYFPIADRPDLGLKIRDDNYEIKRRSEWTLALLESQPLPGKFEAWGKWSLEKLPEAESKLTGLPILKQRRLVNLDMAFNVVSEQTNPPQKIQIEYTEIKIEASSFYSFALEISGFPTASSLLEIARNIPIHPRMTTENCCSYPAFILNNAAKK